MSKQIWVIAGVLTTILLLAAGGFLYYGARKDLEQANAELARARASLATSQTEAGDLNQKLAEGKERIQALEKEKETAVQSQKSLESEMRAALESKDVTISQLQGKLTVNILDRILFDSGEADLKPGGADVLRKVATILTSHSNLRIHVIGHTDNVPIRAALRKRFPSNWELSTARATAAVRFLSEQAGVDPRRLGAVGYGEFRPIADNATPEGRARNRRIAITILSDELVGADTAPSAAILGRPAAGSTNGPSALAPAPTNAPDAVQQTAAAPPVPELPPAGSITQTNAAEAK